VAGQETESHTSKPDPVTASRSVVGAAFTVLFVTTGVNSAFGILFKRILAELGGNRATLALAASAGLGVNALGQPFLGALIDRVGPRRVILPAMALMALGTGLVSLGQHAWHLIFLYGVVAAVGYAGTGILPVSVYMGRWFPGERGFALAVAASGFSLGQLIFAQVATYLAAAVGWRRTHVVLAAILLVFLPVIAAWLRDPPRSAPGSAPAAPTADAARSLDRRTALATGAFWRMTVALMGCGFTDFLLATHLAPFATDLGLSPAVAANGVSLLAAANVAGILAAGSLADRIGARWALVATYLLRAVSLFLLVAVHDDWQLYLFAVLFGATFFTTAPLSATLTVQLFGPAHHGTIFGTANLFHHLSGALGAYAGGLAFDLARSYRPIFVASGLLIVGAAAVTALAGPDRPTHGPL
jgi:MFS family permease